jgi:excisionase family DNA binding protein
MIYKHPNIWSVYKYYKGEQMSRNQNAEALVYAVPEAGKLLGLGRAGSYEAAKRGELPVIRIGRRLMVPKAALHDLLEAVRNKSN